MQRNTETTSSRGPSLQAVRAGAASAAALLLTVTGVALAGPASADTADDAATPAAQVRAWDLSAFPAPPPPMYPTAPLIIATPTEGATVESSRPVFSGTIEPGFLIEVRGNKTWAVLGSAIAGADGSWSITPDTDLGDGRYEVTVLSYYFPTPSAKRSETTLSFTIPTGTSVPPAPSSGAFAVVSPARHATISSRTPVFTGVGHPGATVAIVGSMGRQVAETTIAADGTWSVASDLKLMPGDYLATVSERSGVETRTASVEYSIRGSLSLGEEWRLSPVTLDGPRTVYRGGGLPGATVVIRGNSGRTVASAIVDDDGTWTANADFDLVPGRYLSFAEQVDDGDVLGRSILEYIVR